MKKSLLIISDLWGEQMSDWVSLYFEKLDKDFDLKYYDACKLGDIDVGDYTLENLHQQFVNGGTDKAVNRLLDLEKSTVDILAFSVGGVIGWKASLLGLNVGSLYAVSSTRLRMETVVPSSKVKLYYGSDDVFQPNTDWYNGKKLESIVFENEEHDLYTKPHIVNLICNDLLKSIK